MTRLLKYLPVALVMFFIASLGANIQGHLGSYLGGTYQWAWVGDRWQVVLVRGSGWDIYYMVVYGVLILFLGYLTYVFAHWPGKS